MTDNERDELVDVLLRIERSYENEAAKHGDAARVREWLAGVSFAEWFALADDHARLVAALSAATTQRDEALADRDGARRGEDEAWEKWQVAERRAEALAAQLQQAREFIARARPLLGIGLGNSLGKQVDDLYVAIGAALAAAAPDDTKKVAMDHSGAAAPATTEAKT